MATLSPAKITEQIDIFTTYLKAKNMAGSSIKTYRGILAKYLSTLPECPTRRTAADITAYQSSYQSGATMGQIRGTMQHYYAGVLHQRQKIERVPYPKKERKIPQVLRPAELLRLINGIANTKHKAIVALLYFAALRRSEVCNLKFKHISQSTLFIEQSKGATDRMVPLSPHLRSILKTYFAEYFPAGKCNRESFVFIGQIGGRFTGQQYTGRSVEALVNKLSIKILGKKINPHLLRHCRATDWLNNGFDIYEVSELLGHRNIKTTEIYLHTATDTLEQKMIKADELMTTKAA